MTQATGVETVGHSGDVGANASGEAASARPRHRYIVVQRALVWLFLALVALRYGLAWVDTLGGASLPRIGTMGFTVAFTAFSLLHAADRLGWRRALVFLASCIVVSWGFEAVGIATGAVYGSYHYGAALGAKIAGVPALIPFAWFMMVYASWVVAHILLEGAGNPASIGGALARSVVAAAAMTSWDVVMDPGNARAGAWVWENGGAYFGVPLQNFVGWMATTLSIYVLVALLFRVVPGGGTAQAPRFYGGLPVVAYALVAMDHFLISPFPELHVVAAFGICLIALLALLRLTMVQGPLTLPG
jgi:uncharacterized membrane protein